MLLGLVRPNDGGGRILGHDIVRERQAILPHIGAIVESPAFYPYLSGYDNLRVLARTAGDLDQGRIIEVLKIVDLSARAKDKVKTYSLGMKQRLAIAAALLNKPRIIFLDEPTNGLDPAGTVEMRELIKRLGATGHTIFLSSHQLHEVEQVCDEVAIISQGKLLAQGQVDTLLQHSASLLVEVEPLSALESIAAQMGVSLQVRGPRSATVRLDAPATPRLIAALVHANAQVYQITPQRSSLEQLFLEITSTATNEHQPVHTQGGTVPASANV